MTIVLVIVLIALAFGFIFAKIDNLTKSVKMIHNELDDIRKKIDK